MNRLIRLSKGFIKIVAIGEIGAIIFICFSQKSGFHQIKDNFPDIFRAPNSPCVQNRLRHRPELIQCEFTDSGEQLLSTDVTGFIEPANRKIESSAHKSIGFHRVPRVTGKKSFK